jgi:DNA-binding response OmpR family regulator
MINNSLHSDDNVKRLVKDGFALIERVLRSNSVDDLLDLVRSVQRTIAVDSPAIGSGVRPATGRSTGRAQVNGILPLKPATVPFPAETVIRAGPLELNVNRHETLVQGRPVRLTLLEFRILATLARRPGWVFSRPQILDAVHGPDHIVTDRTVDVTILSIRHKLGSAAECIDTLRGVGYRFKDYSRLQRSVACR